MGFHMRHGQFSDIAVWERAKKNKVYPSGCTLLQVSASKGETLFLSEPSKVDSKYCVITPDMQQIDPLYFYIVLKKELPDYLKKMQTGLNIVPSILDDMPLCWHADREVQLQIAQYWEVIEQEIENETAVLQDITQFKRTMLHLMMA